MGRFVRRERIVRSHGIALPQTFGTGLQTSIILDDPYYATLRFFYNNDPLKDQISVPKSRLRFVVEGDHPIRMGADDAWVKELLSRKEGTIYRARDPIILPGTYKATYLLDTKWQEVISLLVLNPTKEKTRDWMVPFEGVLTEAEFGVAPLFSSGCRGDAFSLVAGHPGQLALEMGQHDYTYYLSGLELKKAS